MEPRSLSGLDVLLFAEVPAVLEGGPVRANDLAHLAGLVDPVGVADEIEGSIGPLAWHKELTVANERLILQPVDVKAVHSHCVILAVDGHTFEPPLLIGTHLVAQRLVLVASLDNLDGISIDLLYIDDVPVVLIQLVVECPLSGLRPGDLAQGVLGDHVLVGLESETCHYSLIFYYNY